MNIVLATDDKFVQHCAVTIISILKNNPDSVNIYILTEGLSEVNKNILNDLVLSNCGNIMFIKVEPDKLKNCPMPSMDNLKHISIATYYRLLIPELIPQEIDKVIYMDCDIVVRKNLQNLWNINIDNHALGAVYQIIGRTVDDTKRLGYSSKYGYFNAGVLLVNLKYWRQKNITNQLFDFLNENRKSIIYHDQDALNGVLFDKCFKLPIKWNMLTLFFMKETLKIVDKDENVVINEYKDYKNQMIKEKDDPSVIHFVSREKPWHFNCDHPFRNEYYKYLNFTIFKDYRPLIDNWKDISLNNSFKIAIETLKRLVRPSKYLSIKSN